MFTVKNLKSLSIAMICAAAALGALNACSRSPQARNETRNDSAEIPNLQNRYAADKADASYVTEVQFNRGMASLNADAIDKINNLVSRARNTGEIDEIKVISWADQEYPSKNVKALPRVQRDLAAQRNAEIKNQIEGISTKIDVDTYNMAERPGALSELFKTQNAKLKHNLEIAGIPTTASKVKMPSKASKAVVMVIMKE
jgi:hypothetical protein